MSNATERKVLTKEQESFVWLFVCSHMDPDDRNPNEVIEQNFNGDRSRYLQKMAEWHHIEFCANCGEPKEGDAPCVNCKPDFQV